MKFLVEIPLFQIFQYGQTNVCACLTTNKPGYINFRNQGHWIKIEVKLNKSYFYDSI